MPYKVLGIGTYCQEELTVSPSENNIFGGGVELNNNMGTVVSCLYRDYLEYSGQVQARPNHHCQTLSECVGASGSNVQHNTFWSAVDETLAVMAQDQDVFPEGKPIPHDQSNVQMPSFFGYVEETMVLVTGCCVGSVLSAEYHDYNRSVERASTFRGT